MSNCTSGCPTQDHATWGECVRGKRLHIVDPGGTGANRKWDSDLSAYADARKAGIQPSGLERSAVDRAVRISESDGVAFSG